jgi:hypothetical protein
MTRREGSEHDLAAALEAYRAAAHAEADALFGAEALEAQRHRILHRLDQAGHPARVLRFPGAPSAGRPVRPISRRWISVAAAAGLLVGILTGQLLHVMPGDTVRRDGAGIRSGGATSRGPGVVPAVATDAEEDDALLNAIDLAVRSTGASDLRALQDITFAYEPR